MAHAAGLIQRWTVPLLPQLPELDRTGNISHHQADDQGK
jgi:hypothetical protein